MYHACIQDRLKNPLAVFAPSIESHNNSNDTFMAEHPYSSIIAGKQILIPWMVGALL